VRNARTTFAVGIDPGNSTGLAIIRGDGFRLHAEQGPPSILDEFALRFSFLTHPGHDVLVGCERFTITADTVKHTAQPTALETIGVVKQLCRLNDWPLYLQQPANAKRLISNGMLRKLKLFVSARDVERADADDANDATRHALLVLAHHRASLFDSMLLYTTM
jgi:hypothetical protein